MLGAGRSRAIDLGQSVHMGHIKSESSHALDHGCRRCCTGNHGLDRPVDAFSHGLRRGNHHGMHDGCPAVVTDSMFANQRKDERRIDLSETDTRARDRRKRPGKTPAVAVKHRQCPQVDRMPRQAPGQHVADRIEIGATMMNHHALRIAGCTRGVVQADCIPFIRRHAWLKARITPGYQCLVVFRTHAITGPVILRIIDIDYLRHTLARQAELIDRLAGRIRKLAIDDQHFAVRVLKHESHRCRVESRVDAVKHRPRHRNAVMRLDHRRGIWQHDRDGVALTDVHRDQTRGQPTSARPQLRPGQTLPAMNDGTALRIDVCRPVKQR